jgi:hypothetical protein
MKEARQLSLPAIGSWPLDLRWLFTQFSKGTRTNFSGAQAPIPKIIKGEMLNNSFIPEWRILLKTSEMLIAFRLTRMFSRALRFGCIKIEHFSPHCGCRLPLPIGNQQSKIVNPPAPTSAIPSLPWRNQKSRKIFRRELLRRQLRNIAAYRFGAQAAFIQGPCRIQKCNRQPRRALRPG